ncbi:MAG: exodeoxyribonuclease VII large subunit [Pseudomonadota bacterium]|nr:exodeoxyribonuclease VII large subunit [Pseudomonadota bacterium]
MSVLTSHQPPPLLPAAERDVYSVSRLNAAVRALLEGAFPLLWVEGEVSNLRRVSSGHVYFSLKDDQAQVNCALFRNRAVLLRGRIDNGRQVLVRARVSLYAARGDYQLIIEHLEDAGDGALRRLFDERRRRLEREGLFAESAKRPLPRFPRRVGVVTSPSGAAVRDVLTVLQRRFPALPVLVYPVPVQGEGAGQRIANMIALAGRRGDCDVLLLVRGGGSLEDLWAFNEEAVARAIRACPVPVVTGVGHETDVTIADFAADLRAPTPSAAAELVSPDQWEWRRRFRALEERLDYALRRRLAQERQRLVALDRRLALQHPGRRLHDQAQRLDELTERLRQALERRLERQASRLAGLAVRLRVQAPLPLIRRNDERIRTLARRLVTAMQRRGDHARQRLAAAGRALDAVSPLRTLGRGYAIVRRYPGGEVVRRAQQVKTGERVEALLGQGYLICHVEETHAQTAQDD